MKGMKYDKKADEKSWNEMKALFRNTRSSVIHIGIVASSAFAV